MIDSEKILDAAQVFLDQVDAGTVNLDSDADVNSLAVHAMRVVLSLADSLRRLADGPPELVQAVRTCRSCGCTDEHGCPEGCYWAAPDLCSLCRDKPLGVRDDRL